MKILKIFIYTLFISGIYIFSLPSSSMNLTYDCEQVRASRVTNCGSYGCRTYFQEAYTSCRNGYNPIFGSDFGSGWSGNGFFDSLLFSSVETSDSDSNPKDCKKGNPIIVGTGNKIQYETDYVGKGEFPLEIRRNYNHFSEHEDVFGKHWISNFGSYLEIESATIINAYRSDGVKQRFIRAGDTWYDSRGSQTKNTIKRNSDSTYTFNTALNFTENYNGSGQLLSAINPEGITHSYSYQNGKLHTITHASGDKLTFNWVNGNLTQIIDIAGNSYDYGYTANKLTQVVRPGTPQITKDYLYSNSEYPNALTEIYVNGKKYASFTYHTDGKGKSTNHWITSGIILNPQEEAVDKYEFEYASNYTVVTNPLGHQEKHIYANVKGVKKMSAIERMVAPNCPAANSGTTYNGFGSVKTSTDWKGVVTEYDYNYLGQLLSQTYAKNTAEEKTTTYIWTAGENRIHKEITTDLEVTYNYLPSGRIDSIVKKNLSNHGTANQVRTTTYSYTNYANGIMASMSVNGPRTDVSDVVTSHFNSNGHLVRMVNALGHETTYSNYDLLGNPGRITSPNGLITDYTYDAQGKILTHKVRHPAGIQTTAYQYNAMGQNTKTTYPDGNRVENEYDQAYRLVKTKDRYDGYIKYELNALGNTISHKIGEEGLRWASPPNCWKGGAGVGTTTGNICQPVLTPYNNKAFAKYYNYDAMGRLQATVGNGGQRTGYVYDNNSNMEAKIDSYGRSTTYTYDALNRIETSTDSYGEVTSYAYDSGGRVHTVTDARGLTTTYNYSGFGELEELISPDTGTSTYDYNKSGQVTRMVRNDGAVSTFSYDAIGRIKTENNGGLAKSYFYDSGTNRKGRLYYVNDNSGQTLYSYDTVGNITHKRSTINSKVYNTHYTYDGMNRVITTTYPSGHNVSYTYNSTGRVSIVRYQNGSTTKLVASNIQYRPFGPMKQMTHGHGVVREISHDLDYRPTKIFTSGIQNLNYLFDRNDNITKVTNSLVSANTQTYGYDSVNRLTSVTSRSGNHSYTYDEVGNRKTHDTSGVNEIFQYSDTSNQLSKVTRNGVHNAVSYTTNGNTHNKDSGVFTYNGENRLSQYVKGRQVTSFKHNALGQRVSKVGSSGSHHYLFNEAGQLMAEHSSTGSVQKEYIYLHGQVIGMIKANVLYYVHNDHLGRAERITDQSKATVWRANNFDFDRAVVQNSIGDYNLGFPGQYYDKETSLYYNYFRDYDPKIGRYIQSDPIGLNGGVNTYGYVKGNPIAFFDPFGLARICYRPLENTGFVIGNETDQRNNTVIGHQQIIFEDAEGGNIGFGPDGLIINEKGKDKQYERCETGFNDKLLRKAAASTPTGEYKLFGNNCQDWAENVVRNYMNLGGQW